LAQAIPVVIGLLGLGGILFTALRFNREDTTAVVGQQTQILGNMKMLNDELRVTADGLRGERDSCRGEAAKLRTQVAELTVELRMTHARLGDTGREDDGG
jgi:hypothetical protein